MGVGVDQAGQDDAVAVADHLGGSGKRRGSSSMRPTAVIAPSSPTAIAPSRIGACSGVIARTQAPRTTTVTTRGQPLGASCQTPSSILARRWLRRIR
jgi:hypothetical protein